MKLGSCKGKMEAAFSALWGKMALSKPTRPSRAGNLPLLNGPAGGYPLCVWF